MVLFNHATREMTAKIVYYGPGLCGKTTNLLVIFDKLDEEKRGKMLSLATKTDRTLFFDLLPVDIGKVGPFTLKIQLYTVPGQVFYNETRKLVLKGADAVVFVADSQPSMIESNKESFQNLLDNMDENQIDWTEIPILIQYNKRDIPGVLSVDDLKKYLGFVDYPHTEASAIEGVGVMETFKAATKLTAKYLMAKVQGKPLTKRTEKWNPPVTPLELPPSAPPSSAVEEAPLDLLSADPIDESPDINPFESSMPFDMSEAPIDDGTPFPDPNEGYEAAEEVSLEQLLEGRERPATMSGDIAVPAIEEEPEEIETVDVFATDAEVAFADEAEAVDDLDEVAEINEVDDLQEITELDEIEDLGDVDDLALDEDDEPLVAAGASQEDLDELREELSALRIEHEKVSRTLTKIVKAVKELQGLIKR